VLSHRGLIFESRQIRWRCLCSSATEKFPSQTDNVTVETIKDIGFVQNDGRIDYPKGYDGFDHLRMWIQQKEAMPNRTRWQRDDQYDAWYTIVTDYNVRALSYETDVLSALAGLASAMATMHGCTYFAGLWKEDLQTGLCWYVTGSEYSNTDTQVANTEVLPSWTWISQRGKEIQFRSWENNHHLVEHEGISLVEHPFTTKSRKITETETAFSSVVQKELMVTGRFRKLAVEEIPKWDHDREGYTSRGDMSHARWVWRVRDITTNKKLGHIAFDSDPVNLMTRHIFCLLCNAREKYKEWQLTCLGLVPTDDTLEVYKRIGLIMVTEMDWLGELQLFDFKDPNLAPWLKRKGRDIRFNRTVRIV
jgi:hypothetical protein